MSESNPYTEEIDDPEEISQKQRIKELLDRRAQTISDRGELYDLAALGEAELDEVREAYRSRIESLIIDVWATLERKAEEAEEQATAREYLEETEIATVEIQPPDDLVPEDSNLGPKQRAPEPKTETIRGLKWFLDNPGAISAVFEVRTYEPPTTERREVEAPVPMTALDQALIHLVKWLNEAGIDADLAEKEQRTQITEELIEEFEDRRRELYEQHAGEERQP